MSNPAKTDSATQSTQVGHETTDVRPGIVGLFGFGLVAMVALVLPLLGWAFRLLEANTRREQRPTSSLQPAETFTSPRLQAQPAVELLNVRREAMTRLTSYGWIDEESGVARVPVDVAIQILADRGIPQPEGQRPERQPQGEKP